MAGIHELRAHEPHPRSIRKGVSTLKRIVSTAIVLTLAGVFIAAAAFARITANTIDPVASVTDDGRQIIATGPIACTGGENVYLRVTVTQRSTGAVAEGRTLLTCTGDTQYWEVHASVLGQEPFQEGPATAVALARTTDRGASDDADQWLVAIRLVGE
jgi:hypothetical protein